MEHSHVEQEQDPLPRNQLVSSANNFKDIFILVWVQHKYNYSGLEFPLKTLHLGNYYQMSQQKPFLTVKAQSLSKGLDGFIILVKLLEYTWPGSSGADTVVSQTSRTAEIPGYRTVRLPKIWKSLPTFLCIYKELMKTYSTSTGNQTNKTKPAKKHLIRKKSLLLLWYDPLRPERDQKGGITTRFEKTSKIIQ